MRLGCVERDMVGVMFKLWGVSEGSKARTIMIYLLGET